LLELACKVRPGSRISGLAGAVRSNRWPIRAALFTGSHDEKFFALTKLGDAAYYGTEAAERKAIFVSIACRNY